MVHNMDLFTEQIQGCLKEVREKDFQNIHKVSPRLRREDYSQFN